MTNHLFNIVNGKAKINDTLRNIVVYNNIINMYGEKTACKIFVVLHHYVDLSPTNVFKDLPETTKFETIISAIAPDEEVDWNSFDIIDAIELTRTLYETPSYRYYIAKKEVLDRAIETIKFAHLDASKESGNADQLSKWDKYIHDAMKTTKEAYKALMEELGAIKVRGQGQVSEDQINDKEIELY